ncbi:MAG: hypothetical protein WD830_05710 [Chloroflexota bacterium]
MSDAVATGTVTFEDGGTVSTMATDGTSFELVVPPGAVAEDTEITVTPLADVEGITAEPGVVHAVQLEPEGQIFFELARLTITPAVPIPVAEQLVIEAAGDGSDPGPALIDPTSEEIVVLLDHFTVAAVAQVTPQQRATFLLKSAANSAKRLQREVAARIGAERERQLLGTSEGEGTPDISDLTEQFESEVLAKLEQAANLTCAGVMTYIRTVIGHERALQLLGLSEADEAASQQRIADAGIAMEARYQECEQQAIEECQAAKDSVILMRFWLGMEKVADPDRAKSICEPEGYQFAFSGTGTGRDLGYPVPIEWQFWGLLCEGTEEWRVWEIFEGVAGSSRTGPPTDSNSVPYLITFDENGSMTSVSWVNGVFPTTLSGNTLALSPGDAPTTVTARLNAGAGVPMLTVTAPVEPADGTIASCEPATAP